MSFLTGMSSPLDPRVDPFDGGYGNDRITGGRLAETIAGTNGHDRLFGAGGNDSLFGVDDHDLVDGGLLADDLTGGNGFDVFRFSSDDALRRPDEVLDFNPVFDQFALEKDVFRALDGRRLERAEFRIIADGEGRIDATDRIIHDQVTGALMYDRDGNPAGPGQGAVSQVFAELTLGLVLSFADFDLVQGRSALLGFRTWGSLSTIPQDLRLRKSGRVRPAAHPLPESPGFRARRAPWGTGWHNPT